MHKPNFARDLKIGQAGELAFIALARAHGIELTQTDGRKGDLLCSTGEIWELKTDSYNMNKTPNFFIELYSDVDKGKSGGPFKALSDGCTRFVYYFSANETAFIFDTVDLCRQVENYLSLEKPTPTEVRNKSWTTIGFRVPRSALSPLQVLHSKPTKEQL